MERSAAGSARRRRAGDGRIPPWTADGCAEAGAAAPGNERAAWDSRPAGQRQEEPNSRRGRSAVRGGDVHTVGNNTGKRSNAGNPERACRPYW